MSPPAPRPPPRGRVHKLGGRIPPRWAKPAAGASVTGETRAARRGPPAPGRAESSRPGAPRRGGAWVSSGGGRLCTAPCSLVPIRFRARMVFPAPRPPPAAESRASAELRGGQAPPPRQRPAGPFLPSPLSGLGRQQGPQRGDLGLSTHGATPRGQGSPRAAKGTPPRLSPRGAPSPSPSSSNLVPIKLTAKLAQVAAALLGTPPLLASARPGAAIGPAGGLGGLGGPAGPHGAADQVSPIAARRPGPSLPAGRAQRIPPPRPRPPAPALVSRARNLAGTFAAAAAGSRRGRPRVRAARRRPRRTCTCGERAPRATWRRGQAGAGLAPG